MSAAATTEPPNYEAIKAKQYAIWGSGDYAKVGTTLQIVGEELAKAMDLHPQSTVLDVAAGNGNATLAFARRWNRVTSTDYVATLLDHGRARAKSEGLDVAFQVADAEALPFEDAAFDGVVSTFGVMFTPNQQQAARELVRVCRSGGKIGLANWTPDGFIGQVFNAVEQYFPRPAGLQSPALWGTEKWISATFGDIAVSALVSSKAFNFRYPSPDRFIDFFRSFYGPLRKAFLALDASGQSALEDDLRSVIAGLNTATDGSMRVPGEYLEIIIEKA